MRGRGSGHLTSLSREFSPQGSSRGNGNGNGTTYSPGGRGGGRGGAAPARKYVDMGAPVFVKAGTLFQDEAHQPDMPVESGQSSVFL